MNKFFSILVMATEVLGIIGFLYLNVAEYSCDSIEEEKDGFLYQYQTCCNYLGFFAIQKDSQSIINTYFHLKDNLFYRVAQVMLV